MRALTLARPNKTPASQAIIDPNSMIFSFIRTAQQNVCSRNLSVIPVLEME